MKTLFIPVKIKTKVNSAKILEISKKLPKNLAIAYSIQYEDTAKEIKNILSKSHKISGFTQILGCSSPNFSKQTQAILLITDGAFHANSLSLILKNNLPIYILYNNALEKISEKEILSLKKKQKSSYLSYLNADKIGILVSTKPNQKNLKKALEFKNKLKNKKSYLFICNNINTSEFENFGISSWVNTACPKLDMNNNSIINLRDLDNFGNL